MRRHPERGVLQRVVLEHLETFLAEARARGGGAGLPRFIEKELRAFLSCGVMASGFARFRCGGCAREILVAFSCKGRGFCPSCCGRRMAVLAAHLVDGVFGDLPVRQWVLTLPHRLRYALAYDPPLCRAVLAVFVRALLSFERRRARAPGVVGRGGAVTAIQRCGSALNTNVHFHTLVAEGVFATAPDGAVGFVPAARPPTDVEVARLLAAVQHRIARLVRRDGLVVDGSAGDGGTADGLALAEPALAAIAGASVVGRVATGPRAAQLVLRLGADATAPVVSTAGPRHAHREGFDLHADAAVRAGDRRRLERLCRYVLRPPVAQDALELTAEGRVLLRLRRPWRDGTRAIGFEPSELLEKLAALVPRPRANLLLYHGAFAARGCWRVARASAPRAEGEAAPAAAPTAGAPVPPSPARSAVASPAPVAPTGPRAPPPGGYVRPRHVAWAELLRRTFALDVLACPDCGGRLRLLATIADPRVIARILGHLGLPREPPRPAPPRQPSGLPGDASQPL
ncbi:transposase [bacterium]|nr:transposase [bacterium]